MGRFGPPALCCALLVLLKLGLSLPFLPPSLLEADSYFFLRQAAYFSGIDGRFVEANGGRLTDRLSYYPQGRDWKREKILWPLALGRLFRALSRVGLNATEAGLESFLLYSNPVLSCAAALLAFLLGSLLCGPMIGFFAAALFCASPAYVFRTWPGSSDKELLGLALILSWLCLYLKLWSAERPGRRALWAALAGLFFNLAGMTWGGNVFFLDVASASALAYFAAGAGKSSLGAFPCLIGAACLWSLPLRSWGGGAFPMDIHGLAAILISGVLAGTWLGRRLGWPRVPASWAAAAGGLALFGLAYWLYRHPPAIFHPVDITRATVLEYRRASLGDLWFQYGLGILLAPMGCALLIKDFARTRDQRPLLLAAWFVLGLIGTLSARRLSFVLSFAAFEAAVVFIERAAKVLGKPAGALGLAVLLGFSAFQTTRLERALREAFDPYVPGWKDAGAWIERNTPHDSLLVSWWDHGYYLQAFGKRATLVDPGNTSSPVKGGDSNRNVDVARAFTRTESQFNDFLSLYDVGKRPVYVVISLQDFFNLDQINEHARDELFVERSALPKNSDSAQYRRALSGYLAQRNVFCYSILAAGENRILWSLKELDAAGARHPEWRDKLVVRLLPFNTSMNRPFRRFRRVYANALVAVYQYVGESRRPSSGRL